MTINHQDNGMKALLSTFKLAFRSLQVVMVVLCIGYLFSNYLVLDSHEQAFRLRFGKLVGEIRGDQVKKPGRGHFILPKPICEVVRIPTRKAHDVSVSFWYHEKFPHDLKQSNASDHSLTPGIDNYLLTGDGNIIHTRWSLSFMINDPVEYYHSYQDPEFVIQNILANIVLKKVASIPIEDAFYLGSPHLRKRVEQEVKRELDHLQLGIALDDTLKVLYDKREVPSGVIPAFNQVTEAEQKLSQKTNEAKIYADQTIQNAKGERARIISEAMSYKTQVTASIKADADYFTNILPKYRLAPHTLLFSLYQQTLQDILAHAKDIYLVNDDQEIRVLTNRPRKSHDAYNSQPNAR